ncbi:hypothetical protein [Actinomadura sp. 7K507]|uniref:hypothetical protein n=1 Tax=Actinomadura sp. 7K507 TaxID=2530365 RepID=UPI00104AC19E|nr:hypothetical protein [Actinomadura sp. 7K507]TDC75078.1 hypothetical protein E1285_42010 [Actinomadura sp. 7K507]
MRKLTSAPLVTVTDLHVSALRAFILEGPDAWEGEQAEKLNDETGLGLSLLIHYSFTAAARHIFARSFSLSQVIRYVADVRLALGDDALQLNPRVAEQLIRSALGDKMLTDISHLNEDQVTKTRAKLLLLVALMTDAELGESGVDELINEAAENARKFDSSSLFSRESADSPHVEGGRDEDTATRSDISRRPSRGTDGGWESP